MLDKPLSCTGCPLHGGPYGKSTGYVPASGDGSNGVMIVLEAAGEDEEEAGMPVVGKAGQSLFQQLGRVGIVREGFTIHNVLSCRPPNNNFYLPIIPQAVAHCAPNLDASIQRAQEAAKAHGKTFVIVTLGVPSFKRIMNLQGNEPLMKADYIAYPHWNDRYSCWVLAADHPAYLLRGKTHLWPVVQFVVGRALEIAEHGLTLDNPEYLLDPSPRTFSDFVDGFLQTQQDQPSTTLSFDIETPYKKKKGEDELGKEEQADHHILRISFSYWCYGKTLTTSIPWSTDYLADIERIFANALRIVGWNSDNYDLPRIRRYVKVGGMSIDGMVAWHVLNTALPKGLGFVTPFYVKNTLMWKHLSESQPAYYNAKDADMALRNYMGIEKHLHENGLWHVFDRHVLILNQVLNYMSNKGVLLDQEMRDTADRTLAATLDEIEEKMEASVPLNARKLKIYKKKPKVDDPTLIEQVSKKKVKYCDKCGLQKPTKTHSTLCPNWAIIELEEPTTVWAKPLEFKISKLGLTNYQKSLKHHAVMDRRKGKSTFDADAIVKLMRQYPKDPLYPLILEYRKVQKINSKYVGVRNSQGHVEGGMPIGTDGRVHTQYSHNPSTLRFASEEPNMQNLPRPSKDEADICNLPRMMIQAEEGSTYYARDFSGIEAVLTGYFAGDPSYIRLAKRDVHTYYTVHALHQLDGRVKAADLPDVRWPDDQLFPYLAQLKKEFGKERNSLYKHLVHAANFKQSPKGAQAKIFSETGIEYPIKTVAKVMDVYYELFPLIPKWHIKSLEEAEKDGFLRNPFGYVHRFSKPFNYEWEYGEWKKKLGPDANKIIAFRPQSTAAAIIKEAMIRLYFNRFEEAGQYLRLQVHDELFLEVPKDKVDVVDNVVREEMERPIPELKLPASWNMGEYLVILTESKEGERWGSMH